MRAVFLGADAQHLVGTRTIADGKMLLFAVQHQPDRRAGLLRKSRRSHARISRSELRAETATHELGDDANLRHRNLEVTRQVPRARWKCPGSKPKPSTSPASSLRPRRASPGPSVSAPASCSALRQPHRHPASPARHRQPCGWKARAHCLFAAHRADRRRRPQYPPGQQLPDRPAAHRQRALCPGPRQREVSRISLSPARLLPPLHRGVVAATAATGWPA